MYKQPYNIGAIYNNYPCCFQLFYGSFDRSPLTSGFFLQVDALMSVLEAAINNADR